MKNLKLLKGTLAAIVVLFSQTIFAQSSEKINWITFSQLEDSLKANPKKVFVDFYADWCVICKELEMSTFTDEKIIKNLNENYYSVKMNVETLDTIQFGGKTFVNKRHKKLNPIHEIPLLMASRKGRPFSLPALILFDEEFKATARYFQYLNSSQLKEILNR